MNLFASGPVPRELIAGVVWDAAAEARFDANRAAMEKTGRFTAAQAEQEARWAVENDLHRKFYRRLVERGSECRYDREKQEVFAEWKRLYGEERAGRAASILRDEKMRAKVLKEW